MKFKLDENFGPTVQRVFLQNGMDCDMVRDEGLAGADDPSVLSAAIGADRVLVTMDRDFGNVLAYPPRTTCGIVVVNVPGRALRRLLGAVSDSFLAACRTQELRGKLWIVEPGRIREHQSTSESEDE